MRISGEEAQAPRWAGGCLECWGNGEEAIVSRVELARGREVGDELMGWGWRAPTHLRPESHRKDLSFYSM